MMGLKKFSISIRYFQNHWSFVVRDVDVEKAFGRVGKDIDRVGFGWFIWICCTITSLCKRWVKDKRIDIGLDTSDGKGTKDFS